ncbi:MAG: caspase family protein [Cyanobacteriota bacterium]
MSQNASRDALVVGINTYKTPRLKSLRTPSENAEAIAQRLTEYGNFRVKRIPESVQKDNSLRVGRQTEVSLKQLRKAIEQLFLPEGGNIPDTALLFFSGHGLRDDSRIKKGYLATSDVNPDDEKWGLPLPWLRELLEKSSIKQQIVWLDCCYSGELFNVDEHLKEADPGNQEDRDRCLITASRGFEVAYEEISGIHGVLTGALLKGLDPQERPDGWVTTETLADFINKELKTETQRPLCHNSGSSIILTTCKPKSVNSPDEGICPYKGLEYFKQEDAHFFWGRTALTDELIEQVRTENFIAILGASGSGKSSVLRAGLLHQLNLGVKLTGSNRWQIYQPFAPGEHPLQNLEAVIDRPANELNQLVTEAETSRVVLVVDQFEECFTMCQDSRELEQFFDCLLSAVEREDNKLCLVLAMRADFLGKCTEYAGLANKIDKHFVTVKPMTSKELEEAIVKPAEQVGLEVQPQLVTRMIEDVADSPGSLPLLQYTLMELWKARQEPVMNWLTLFSYEQLGGDKGGIKGILEKRANEVYESLNEEEKPVAQRIFLELTQLGEVADTRRRARKEDLINSQHSEALLDGVIRKLAEARLITTTEAGLNDRPPARIASTPLNPPLLRGEARDLTPSPYQGEGWGGVIPDSCRSTTPAPSKSQDLSPIQMDALKPSQLKPNAVIDITHEALIRHWEKLRDWVEDYRIPLEIERRIEADAKEWTAKGKPEGLLLREGRLVEAEDYQRDYLNLGFLDGVAQEFIEESIKLRDRLQREKDEQLQREQALNASLKQTLADKDKALTESKLREQSARVLNLLPVQPLDGLVLAIQTMGLNLEQLSEEKILAPVQDSLNQAMTRVRMPITLEGHKQSVYSVAISPDGKMIVSGSEDSTVQLWDISGNPIGQPLRGHNSSVMSVAISPDGKMIVSGSLDKTVRLWDISGNPIGQLLEGHKQSVYSVAISPDGKMIVSGGLDKTVRLWDISGNPIGQSLHEGWVYSVAISPDSKMIVSGSQDKTVRLWDIQGNPIGQPLRGHEESVMSVAISPDGKTIASGSQDKTVRLWDIQGNPIGQPLRGHEKSVMSVAISPDGKMIVSGSEDSTVRLWDISGNPIGQPLRGHEKSVMSVAISPDDKMIVSGSRDKTVQLWDIQGNPIGQPLRGHEESVMSVAISPDDKMIVSGSQDKTVRLWDIQGKPIGQPLRGHNSSVTSVAISTDGKMIVSGSQDKTVWLGDISGNPIGQPLEGHEKSVTSVAISPDSKMIVSGSQDKTVRLWDISGNPIGQPLEGHEKSVMSVAISPDGKMIVSGSADKTVRLWDIQGKPIGQPLEGHEKSVMSVAISPDGKMIVSCSADKTVRLWDIQGNPIGQLLRRHEESVMSVVFSPDSKMIVSGSRDKTVRLWDIQGNPIGQPLRGHEESVMSVAISTDGKMIVSGSQDKTVRLWRGSWQSWLEVCCNRLRYHPVFKNPQTEVEKQACETCQKYVWSQEES